MKHIKLFEDKSNEQLISDINDIFLELIDIGFNIIIHPNYDRKMVFIIPFLLKGLMVSYLIVI